MAGEWVAITAFVLIAATVITFLILHFKYKQRLQDTLHLAIENGQQLSTQTVDALMIKNKPFVDLKKGVILITLGIAFSICLLIVPNKDAMDALPFGVFPMIIGLGYIVVWRLRPKFDV